MSKSLLLDLVCGNPDLVEHLILEEFPDLFDLTNSHSPTEKERKRSCIDKVKNDLIAAKSAPLLNPPSKFETLPELIEVSRTCLTPGLPLPLQKYLVLLRHAISIGERLFILPAEFLDPISALGREYFIIECESSSIFYRNYALYKSLMIATNCCYFSNRFLAPGGMRGYGHRQAGALDLFSLPQLLKTKSATLKRLGQSLYQKDKNAILGKPSISVEDLCNPDSSSPSGVLLRQIDKTIDSLYDFSGLPKGLNIDRRQWALLKLYAHRTQFLKVLKRL